MVVLKTTVKLHGTPPYAIVYMVPKKDQVAEKYVDISGFRPNVLMVLDENKVYHATMTFEYQNRYDGVAVPVLRKMVIADKEFVYIR